MEATQFCGFTGCSMWSFSWWDFPPFKFHSDTSVGVSLDNKVEMTAPVLMKMENQHKYFWQKKVFSMSFLLPSEHQASPPAPTDDKVRISDKSWQKDTTHQTSGFQVYFPIANYEPLPSCRWKLWRCQLWTCTCGALEDGWRACLEKAKQKRCPLPSIQLVQSTRLNTTMLLDITGDWIDTILPKGQRKPPIFVFFNKNCVFLHAYVSCSPMTLFNRHNEVWFVVEDDPVCSSSEELD